MQSYHDKLTTEIGDVLDALAAKGERWHAQWITHAICDQHAAGLVEGDDADFWKYTGYQTVRTHVRKVISDRAGDGADRASRQQQIALPGFERDHIQDYYLVNREGDDVAVPIVSLTDAEIEAKASLYRSMGRACFAHADELDRFVHWRASRQPVAVAAE